MKTYDIELKVKVTSSLTQEELKMKIVKGIFDHNTAIKTEENKRLEIIEEKKRDEKEIEIYELEKISPERAKALRLLNNIEEIGIMHIEEDEYFEIEDRLTMIIKQLKSNNLII